MDQRLWGESQASKTPSSQVRAILKLTLHLFNSPFILEAGMPPLNLTANIGLVLFLFLVGLEIDTRLMKRNIKAAVSVSVAGLLLPLGLGAALGVGVYREFINPSVNFGYFVLFTAVAVGITAFPVLCRILTELKLLDTTVGVVTLSAGVGNDVVGWILLALTVALVNASSGLTALWVLLTSVGYVIFLMFPVKWAYVWLCRRTGSLEQGSPTTLTMTVTLLIVFISAFFTDIIGVHAIFGQLCRNYHRPFTDFTPCPQVDSWRALSFLTKMGLRFPWWKSLKIWLPFCSYLSYVLNHISYRSGLFLLTVLRLIWVED